MLIERDENGVAHIVALSGGHDSTILAVLLKERNPGTPYNYVCTPTGDELPEMFAHWRDLSERLGRRIIPVMNGTLKSVIREQKALPNFRMRWCTRILKIEPFLAFVEAEVARGPVVAYVGLRADEEGRAGGVYDSVPDVSLRFPLREWGMADPDVLQALADRGIRVPNRTDCARCYHQRIGEWFELWDQHRDIFNDAIVDEWEYGATYRTPGRDSWPSSLAEMALRFERGDRPERSLARMAAERNIGACRVCTL